MYTISPVHNIDKLVQTAKDYHALGVDGFVIGDMAATSYWEGIRAGADYICTTSTNLSGCASLPSSEVMTAMLQGTKSNPGYDLDLLGEINDYIGTVCEKNKEYFTSFTCDDVSILKHQIPGGMLSNLENQLRMMNSLHRIDEVFEEVQVVRKDMGYPPLATPFSQTIFRYSYLF